jgi:hypothetical protein
MGIKGLETFMDQIYRESGDMVFDFVKLKDLKLVIDGNQIPYIFFAHYGQCQFGGNYGEIYEKLKEFFLQLKPYIEIIIFDGSKDLHSKAMMRLRQKLIENSNLKQKCENNAHEILRKIKPSFSKILMDEVLEELDISYAMSCGMADHAVACYANGFNKSKKCFPVLSRDSYFNVYDLKAGYVSMRYVETHLTKKKLRPRVQIPVFKIKKLCKYYDMSYETYFYFCVCLGDYDIDLLRNEKLFKKIKCDTNDFNYLLAYFHQNKAKFNSTNFKAVRETYSQRCLNEIDKLHDLFTFKTLESDFIQGLNGSLNDFDRFILNFKDMKKVYLNSFVEDFKEENLFHSARHFQVLDLIYSVFNSKYPDQKLDVISEYSRVKNPYSVIDDKLIIEREVKVADFDLEKSFLYGFLMSSKLDKEMTLFLTCCALWHKWLSLNEYHTKVNISNEQFIDVLFTNFVILNLKNDLKSAPNAQEIIDLYEQSDNESKNRKIKKDGDDLPLIHRLNEFQTMYFLLGVLNKLSGEFGFSQLSVKHFMNCCFLVQSLHELNETNSKIGQILGLIRNSEPILSLKRSIEEKFRIVYNELFKSDSIIDNFNQLNINNS